jgi:hypothetical protein
VAFTRHHDRQGGHGIDPPRTGRTLCQDAQHNHRRQPAACYGLLRIGTHRATAERVCDRDLAPCQQIHDRHRQRSNRQSTAGEFLSGALPQLPTCGHHPMGRQRQQQAARDPTRRPLRSLGYHLAGAYSTVSRQISTLRRSRSQRWAR